MKLPYPFVWVIAGWIFATFSLPGCERARGIFGIGDTDEALPAASEPDVITLAEGIEYLTYRDGRLRERLLAHSADVRAIGEAYHLRSPRMEFFGTGNQTIRFNARQADYLTQQNKIVWRNKVSVILTSRNRLLTEEAIYDQTDATVYNTSAVSYVTDNARISGDTFLYDINDNTFSLNNARIEADLFPRAK